MRKSVLYLISPFAFLFLFFQLLPVYDVQASTDTTPPTITNSFTGTPQTTSIISLTASDGGGNSGLNTDSASSQHPYVQVYKNGSLINTDNSPWSSVGSVPKVGSDIYGHPYTSYIYTDVDQTLMQSEEAKFIYEYKVYLMDNSMNEIIHYMYSNTPLNLTWVDGSVGIWDTNGKTFDLLDQSGLHVGVTQDGISLVEIQEIYFSKPDPTYNLQLQYSFPLGSYVNGDNVQLVAHYFDNAGNEGVYTSPTYTIGVADTAPPTIAVNPNGNTTWSSNNKATITATDSASGVKSTQWQTCNVGGSYDQTPYNCTALTSVPAGIVNITLPEGEKYHGMFLGVIATDNSGNKSTEQFYKFFTDTIAPSVGASLYYENSYGYWIKAGSSITQHILTLHSTDSSSGNKTETLRFLGTGADQGTGKDIQASHDFTKWVDNTYIDDWGYYEGTYDADNINYYQPDPLITFTDAHTTWDGSDSGSGLDYGNVSTNYYFTTTCALCTFDVYSEWTDAVGHSSGYTNKAFTLGIDGTAPTFSFPNGDGSGDNWHGVNSNPLPNPLSFVITDQGAGLPNDQFKSTNSLSYTIYKDGATYKTGTIKLYGGMSSTNSINLPSLITQSGTYQITFSVADAVGNIGTYTTGYYHVDLDLPTATFSPNGTGGVWTNQPQFSTITVGDTGGSGIALWEYETADTNYSYVSGAGTSQTITLSKDGKNTIYVHAKDGAGNNSYPASQQFWIDQTPPTISISGIAEGGSFKAPNITFSTSDATSGIKTGTQTATITNNSTGTTSAFTSGTTLVPAGNYTLMVSVQDNAGNTNSQTVHFTVLDSTAPTITVSRPSEYTWSTNNQLTVTVTDNESGVSSWSWEPCYSTRSSYCNAWNGPFVGGTQTITLPEGNNYIHFQTTDNAGNTGTTYYHYQIDTLAPTIGSSSKMITYDLYSNGVYWSKPGKTQAFRTDGKDNASGLKSEEVRLIGMGKDIRASHDWRKNVVDNGYWYSDAYDDYWVDDYQSDNINYYQQDSSVTFARGFTDLGWYSTTSEPITDFYYVGNCTFCMYDAHEVWQDNAGNTKDSLMATIGFDGQGPTISFPSGDKSGGWFNQIPSPIPFTITDQGSGIKTGTIAYSYTITKDGTPFYNGTVSATSSDGITANGSLSLQSIVNQTGNYRITINTQDNLGNTGTVTTGVYQIDIDKPNGIFSPNSGQGTSGGTLTTTFTPSDIGGSGIMKWRYQVSNDKGTSFGSFSNYITGVTSQDISFNDNGGTWLVRAEVTDNAGNISTITSGSFSFADITPPTGTITTGNTSNWTNSVSLVAIGSDGQSGMYKIENPDGTYTYGSTSNFTVYNNGTYTFVFEDNGGNTYSQSITITNIDNNPPFGWGLYISPSTYTNQNVTIYVNGTDMESGVNQIILPDGTTVNQTNASYTVSTNGIYKFTIIDNAGLSYDYYATVSNIDKTQPTIENLTVVKEKNGTYQVTVTPSDTSGIASVQLSDGQNIDKTNDGDYYLINNLVSLPSYVRITDTAGNSANYNFLDIPILNYSSSASNQDVPVTFSGSGTLSYKIDYKYFSCSSNPCTFSVSMNSTITAINKNGNDTAMSVFEVNNIDKTNINFVLSGTRSTSNSGVLNLSWNKPLSSGVLVCNTPGGEISYDISGTSYSIAGKNYQYNCQITGTTNGTPVQSNWLDLEPNTQDGTMVFIKPSDTMPSETFGSTVNVYVEKNPLGEFYLINGSTQNEGTTSVPIANSIH